MEQILEKLAAAEAWAAAVAAQQQVAQFAQQTTQRKELPAGLRNLPTTLAGALIIDSASAIIRRHTGSGQVSSLYSEDTIRAGLRIFA